MSGMFNIKGVWWRHFIPMLILNAVLLMPFVRNAFILVGLRWLYILYVSFAISFCLTPLFRSLAYRFNILDIPDNRKLHAQATPLLGGAPVFLAFLAALLINGIFSVKLVTILAAALTLFLTGVVDDLKEIPAWVKLVVQLLCSALVIFSGIILRVIPDTLGFFSLAGNTVLTIIWIIGITNAMNFFDGMDGMASGLAVIISFFLGIVAFQTNQPFIGWIAVALMGSCIGFIPYNLLKKRKATIFLGDAGSTVIGFILACVAVYGDWAQGNAIVAFASPILIFWVLIFDMVHITIDRIFTGKVKNLRQWIDYVGTDHLHHRMAGILGSKKRSVFFIYLLSVCLGISAIALRNARTVDALVLLVQACVFVVLITILERRGRFLSEKNNTDDS